MRSWWGQPFKAAAGLPPGLLLLVATCTWGQSISTIYVGAAQVRLTSGDSIQLTAIARDASGNVVPNVNFTWTSKNFSMVAGAASNASVIRVDANGMATADTLGIADVTATASGRSGVLRLQVLPQRVEVSPANTTLTYGSQQQFNAVAYDSSGQPLSYVGFTWHVMVTNGQTDSTTVPISSSGVVSARTLGYYIVRASIPYPNLPDQFQREFDGSTPMTIVPGEYKLTMLASSDTVYPQTSIRGRRSRLAINDAGQLVFPASFDGLNSGVVSWNGSGLSVLAAAGSPGVIQGTVYYDFDNLSIDSRGNVVASAAMLGSNTSLVMINGSGVQLVLPDRPAADAVLDVTSISTGSQSLSESGDIVLRANFHYPDSTVNYNGLLRYSGRSLILEASSKDPLPGLSGAVNIENYAIDNRGVIYFSASAGSARAIYRKEIFQDPVKVIAVNDSLNGLRVTTLSGLIVGTGGDLVVQGGLSDGTQVLARYPGGYSAGQAPIVMSVLPGYINQVWWDSSQGGVVWLGDGGPGYGLYYWAGDNSRPRLLLTQYAPAPNGEPVVDFYHAVVDGNGNVYASVRGAETPWMLFRVTGTPLPIAANGTPVPLAANFDLSGGLLIGDKMGSLHVTAGGNPVSVFQLDSRGALPTLVLGDRLPGGATYMSGSVRKSASGDLYVTQDNGVFRLSNAGASIVLGYPFAMSDGVFFNSAFNLAVNDHNQLLLIGGTNQSHQRLLFVDNGSARTIAFFGGSPPYQTPSPSGGVFSGLFDLAINEAGQAMISASVNGGPGGLFFYDGKAWQSTCLLQVCQMDGETITGIGALRAANNRLCAQFSTSAGNSRLDCWENGSWLNIIKRNDVTSDGTEITNVNNQFDVNRRGDTAVVVNTGLGFPEVFLKAPDGFATVLSILFPPPGGDYVQSVYSIDLRDDRRVFLIVQEFSGRMVAYEADPQF
jgi:hypothetical protein